MKAPDLLSVLVAAAIGAAVLLVYDTVQSKPAAGALVTGAIVGAAVQVGVRLVGVS